MNPALLALALAAVCSGSAAVVQASAVARVPTANSVSVGFALRLIRNPRYLVALALIAAGFGLSFVALRTLPLFVVQAGRASSLAVTALLSVLALRIRMRRSEVVAVVAIGAGLVLVAVTSAPQVAVDVDQRVRFGLLAAAVAVVPAAALILRMTDRRRSGLLMALLAGCCFGLLALGARIIHNFTPTSLVTDPTAWATGVAGGLGLLCGAMALQRATVMTVTAAMVATETVLGSLLGMIVCADRPAAGLLIPATSGFTLVLAGALALARFGAPEADTDGREQAHRLPIG